MKIHGQKNELSENEKQKFYEKLNSKYEIYSQLGTSGARTSAYLMRDIRDINGEEFVLKIPNDENDSAWIISQRNTFENCKKALSGYDGDVYIPNNINFYDMFTVEPYAGTELTPDIYRALTEPDKNKIANDLAYFYYYLHTNNNISDVLPLEMFFGPALDEVFDYLQDSLDEKQRLFVSEKIKCFKSRDIKDEISVMTHADIRSQNILYNQQTKKLAVIDFEVLKARNIYHDFVPFAAASFGLPYELLFETVGKYNSLMAKTNIFISSEKVKLFHELGIIHEYGRVAISMKMTGDELKNQCLRIFNRIKEVQVKNIK